MTFTTIIMIFFGVLVGIGAIITATASAFTFGKPSEVNREGAAITDDSHMLFQQQEQDRLFMEQMDRDMNEQVQEHDRMSQEHMDMHNHHMGMHHQF